MSSCDVEPPPTTTTIGQPKESQAASSKVGHAYA
jgi:hypothetical protein